MFQSADAVFIIFVCVSTALGTASTDEGPSANA